MPRQELIDPWAGKSLGHVSKPEGFDEFWRQHEQVTQGGTSSFLAQQEAALRHADARPKPQRAHDRGGTNGRGKGKRNFQRYSVPWATAPRARPTHFVAIRLSSRMIRRNVEQMQQWFIDKDPLFRKCVVPTKKLHSSLLLTSIPEERRDEAQRACHQAGKEIRSFLGDQPLKLICSGVGSFNGNVLFARIRTEPHEILQAIHDALSRSFARHGFPVLDESAKAWLDDGEQPHSFKAHASFIKTSKALAHACDDEKKQFRTLRVTAEDIEAWKDVFFGSQLCHEFELLHMIGTTRDGYYPRVQLEQFHDRPIGSVSNSLPVPLAAGPLRTGHLRVERGDAGAGLVLSSCSMGYLIEQVLEWPGQPDLHEGDIIIALGQSLLLDLEESQLEELFGESFVNNASVVVGPQEILQRTQRQWLRACAERLVRPWQRVASAAEEAEGASVYTEGGTRLEGLRYRLRTAATSFVPDPLSQPGGDPWAEAAEAGHAYPHYTGWGTQFKTRRATTLDSSHFLRRTHVADAGPGNEVEEHTAVHRQLRSELRGARSQQHVLEIVADRRALLSISNRGLALVRFASSGWLLDEHQNDARLLQLLSDLQEDLNAVEEAQESLTPMFLSSVALALGRLGFRLPVLFHALATLIQRTGIWTFSDEEVASVLEGFSRSKLVDEVMFQDAARLVVVRVKKLAPRTLTTMLTAFACSNVATEHLFFAAGDAVIDRLSHFSTGLLAELADAFSRVRARHALLLEVLPVHFTSACLQNPRRCSVDSLVRVLSAYADSRLELGPEGLREDAAAALCQRTTELSSRLMRQALQAMVRARWPNSRLLETAGEVAARDPKAWELDAMRECFDQLRVSPPASFPTSGNGEPGRADLEQRAAQPTEAIAACSNSTAGASDIIMLDSSTGADLVAIDANQESMAAAGMQLREVRLRVDPHVGAGLDMFACAGGYYVDGVSDGVNQGSLFSGDVVVAIEGQSLSGLDEDEVERRFGASFWNGALLIVGKQEHLQKFPLEELLGLIEECVSGRAIVPQFDSPTKDL